MKLLTKENARSIGYVNSVYSIYAYTKSLQPIPINRVGGIDKSGLLYTGQTVGRIVERLIEFITSSTPGNSANNHLAGVKYKERSSLRESLGEHILVFKHEYFEVPLTEEQNQLLRYTIIFGELPPLNH